MNMLNKFFNGVSWVIFLAFVVIGLMAGIWISDYVNATRKFYETFPEWKIAEQKSDSFELELKDYRHRLDSVRISTVYKIMRK